MLSVHRKTFYPAFEKSSAIFRLPLITNALKLLTQYYKNDWKLEAIVMRRTWKISLKAPSLENIGDISAGLDSWDLAKAISVFAMRMMCKLNALPLLALSIIQRNVLCLAWRKSLWIQLNWVWDQKFCNFKFIVKEKRHNIKIIIKKLIRNFFRNRFESSNTFSGFLWNLTGSETILRYYRAFR